MTVGLGSSCWTMLQANADNAAAQSRFLSGMKKAGLGVLNLFHRTCVADCSTDTFRCKENAGSVSPGESGLVSIRVPLLAAELWYRTCSARPARQSRLSPLRPGPRGSASKGRFPVSGSVDTSMAGFAAPRTGIPAVLRYPAAVSRRIRVAC